MNKKTHLLFITLLTSFLMISVHAQISVGLKEGDWVEYTATYTGNPPETYPKTARIEVQTIQGTLITVEINSILLNETQTSITEIFDLNIGAPDLIIIPANLRAGDEVFHEDIGTFTIEGVAEYTFEGTTRELVHANVMQTELSWDRTTGIVIEAESISDTHTQTFLAVNTNIVQTQASDLYPMLLYAVIAVVIIVLVVIAILVLRRTK